MRTERRILALADLEGFARSCRGRSPAEVFEVLSEPYARRLRSPGRRKMLFLEKPERKYVTITLMEIVITPRNKSLT